MKPKDQFTVTKD